MENGAKIEIKITDLDYNSVARIEKDEKFYSSLGWESSFPAAFAKIVNQMMNLLGYVGYDKDYIFLESVTLEEYDELMGYLQDLRANKQENQE